MSVESASSLSTLARAICNDSSITFALVWTLISSNLCSQIVQERFLNISTVNVIFIWKTTGTGCAISYFTTSSKVAKGLKRVKNCFDLISVSEETIKS